MLDLVKLLPQIGNLTSEQECHVASLGDALKAAGAAIERHGPLWEDVARRVEGAQTSWLLATPLEPFDAAFPCPVDGPCDEYVALAADGSQIAPDRHEVAFCCVLNTGRVHIRYGPEAEARLASEPRLIFRDEDMFEEERGNRVALGGKRLALRRMEAECEALTALMEDASADGVPALALWDGSLILWPLENEAPGYIAQMLGQLEAMLATGQRLGIPVAGYISSPGSRDVVNTLRVCLCPHQTVDCNQFCPLDADPGRRATPCSGVAEATDAALFGRFLGRGERSALFAGSSRILRSYRAENVVRWFYLNTGAEVVRAEVPAWVAEDPALLGRVHALSLDQAAAGRGYPPALAEAHECAVVRGADREAFFRLVEAELVKRGLQVRRTRKAITKRGRYV